MGNARTNVAEKVKNDCSKVKGDAHLLQRRVRVGNFRLNECGDEEPAGQKERTAVAMPRQFRRGSL